MKQYIKSPENKETLFPLVKKECELIKQHFTQEEINKLFKNEIEPDSEAKCLYGTMVGSCNDPRVNTFIKENLDVLVQCHFFEQIEGLAERNRSHYFMTPLEEYIYEDAEWDDYEYTIHYSQEAMDRVDKVINLLK